MAPLFTPATIRGLTREMHARGLAFAKGYADGQRIDAAADMTTLTYEILAATLFSDEIAGAPGRFAQEIETLFESMGRTDPLDVFGVPDWVPRLGRRARRAHARLLSRDRSADHRCEAPAPRRRRAAGLPHPAARGRGEGIALACRGRGQHHHLHRRRP